MWRERVSYILISSLAFVSTGDRRAAVKSVTEVVFVSTGKTDNIVEIVEAVESASTVDRRTSVKNAVVVEYAIMARGRIGV
jgi:hypothetical protein